MMVIDSSALMAIQFDEPEAKAMRRVLRPRAMLGSPNLLEYLMVVGSRYGDFGRLEAEALLERLDVAVISFDENMAKIAADAFIRYGKGHHPAKLNFGDCMAYALAKSLGAPLLYKGGDFALTDIRSAL